MTKHIKFFKGRKGFIGRMESGKVILPMREGYQPDKEGYYEVSDLIEKDRFALVKVVGPGKRITTFKGCGHRMEEVSLSYPQEEEREGLCPSCVERVLSEVDVPEGAESLVIALKNGWLTKEDFVKELKKYKDVDKRAREFMKKVLSGEDVKIYTPDEDILIVEVGGEEVPQPVLRYLQERAPEVIEELGFDPHELEEAIDDVLDLVHEKYQDKSRILDSYLECPECGSRDFDTSCQNVLVSVDESDDGYRRGGSLRVNTTVHTCRGCGKEYIMFDKDFYRKVLEEETRTLEEEITSRGFTFICEIEEDRKVYKEILGPKVEVEEVIIYSVKVRPKDKVVQNLLRFLR